MTLRLRVEIVLLVLAALVCALVAAQAGGPARFVAGSMLALVIPARLAVLSVAGRLLRLTVAVPLGLVVCAVVGALLALTHAGFGPGATAGALFVACVVLAALALRGGLLPAVRFRFSGVMLVCALPTLVLTGLVVWRVAAAANEPGPAYTEFAVDSPRAPFGSPTSLQAPLGSPTSLQVRSHETSTRRFRLETTVDGQASETAEFDLRPGQSVRFVVFGRGDGSVRARLYVTGDSAPYRELTL